MATSDFIDECRIQVCGGDGGRGCASFRREKFVPKGGPDGGDGGRGGSVIFEGDEGMATLLDTHHRKHYRAKRGDHGRGAQKTGHGGEDVVVRLPLGTVVKDDESGETLCEVLKNGEQWVAAAGGRGGWGNIHFATSTNRTPREFQPGEPGQDRWLRLELKVLADVGLLGFPNAGKSTLVSRVSAAKPRIANYPFTTLHPNLGMVEIGDTRFVMADIPGLIPGAHMGTGLGDRFLRHVERTRSLVHLLDPEPPLRGDESRGLLSDYRALRHELASYSSDLVDRAEIVCIAKSDLVPDEKRELLSEELTNAGIDVRWISSSSGEGISELVQELAKDMQSA